MSSLPTPNLKLRTSAIALLAASILLFLASPSFAQQAGKPYRIGVLSPGSSQFGAVNNSILPAFQRLGYDNGTNGTMEIRYAEGRMERLPELAADLVRLEVDLIVAVTNMSAFAAKEATTTIPIVVWAAHDAVGTGLVRSLARPGGNVTGVESMAPELDIKRIELLKEILPGCRTWPCCITRRTRARRCI